MNISRKSEKEMTHIKSNDTYFCGHDEDSDTADFIILKASVVLITISNIILNSLLIWKIYTSNKKTRTNTMFLILSVSDLLIGLISLPMFCFTLFHLSSLPIYISECNLNLFIMHLPLYCSWYWTVAIAIDRLFIIKYNIKYESVISKKILLRSLLIVLIVFISILILFFFVRQRVETIIAASVFQLLLTATILVTYMYILYYSRRKLHAFENNEMTETNKLQRRQASLRLTRTIFYIFRSQVILALPVPIINFIYMEHWGDPELERKLRYWTRALFFSNSIANALILLRGQMEKRSKDIKQNQPIIQG